MKDSWILGIDVGGTKIAAGCVRFPTGEPVPDPLLAPTNAARGGRAVLDTVLQLVRQLADARVFTAIGLGICELVDHAGRLTSANCVDWLDLPAKAELSRLAPAFFEADVRAAALAEAAFGAGRPFHNFLYVTVGTGISCCLMIEGKAYLGSRGLTGTMASSPIRVPCDQCGAEHASTLEAIASGPALVARFRHQGGRATTGQEVLQAATHGDPVAQKIIRSASCALESQIGLLVNVLDPEAVVIGGGLGLSEGPFWEQLVLATRQHVWSQANRELPILRARLGADAGWIGAATRAWQESSKTSLPQTIP